MSLADDRHVNARDLVPRSSVGRDPTALSWPAPRRRDEGDWKTVL
jgi:hypothetical protein